MSSLDQMRIDGETCDYYDHESNLASMDNYEVSCMTCSYWDGRDCARKTLT